MSHGEGAGLAVTEMGILYCLDYRPLGKSEKRHFYIRAKSATIKSDKNRINAFFLIKVLRR